MKREERKRKRKTESERETETEQEKKREKRERREREKGERERDLFPLYFPDLENLNSPRMFPSLSINIYILFAQMRTQKASNFCGKSSIYVPLLPGWQLKLAFISYAYFPL